MSLYLRFKAWLLTRLTARYRRQLRRVYEKPSQFPRAADYRVSSEMKGKR